MFPSYFMFSIPKTSDIFYNLSHPPQSILGCCNPPLNVEIFIEYLPFFNLLKLPLQPPKSIYESLCCDTPD